MLIETNRISFLIDNTAPNISQIGNLKANNFLDGETFSKNLHVRVNFLRIFATTFDHWFIIVVSVSRQEGERQYFTTLQITNSNLC